MNVVRKRIRLEEDEQRDAKLLNFKLHLSNAYEKLYLDETTTDVTLIIEGTKVPAHRIILATASEFFMLLFYGEFCEKDKKEIEMLDVSLEAFKICLQYMYFHVIEISKWCQQEELLLAALEHAHRFDLKDLEKGIEGYLGSIINDNNVIPILSTANLLSMKTLVGQSVRYACHTGSVFRGESFLDLDLSTVLLLLEPFNSDYNTERELNRFSGVRDWLQQNAETVTVDQRKTLLSYVKLEYMTQLELINVVKPTKLFEDTEIQAVLALTGFTVRTISNCTNPEFLQATNYFAAHAEEMIIDGVKSYAVVIELEAVSYINHISFNLPEPVGYKIDISMHRNGWTSVIDYSCYSCQDLQKLYFSPAVKAKFVRIRSNKFPFKCNRFKVDYALNALKVFKTFVCPSNLLDTNGDIETYVNFLRYTGSPYYDVDDGSSFERHPISDGLKLFNEDSSSTTSNAQIIFFQPYYMNSIEFLRVDDENCCVKVQTFDENCEMIVHACKQTCASWHKIRFPAMPIVGVVIESAYDGEPVEIEKLNVSYVQDV